MVAVAGPRIDPASVAAPDRVEVRGYLPELHRHLAACDLAVVQGGLTTTMELVAARPPVRLRAAGAPLRAADPRAATPRAVPRRAPAGLRRHRSGRGSPTRSPPRSTVRSTTGRWRPTAPRGPRRCWPSCCSRTWNRPVPHPGSARMRAGRGSAGEQQLAAGRRTARPAPARRRRRGRWRTISPARASRCAAIWSLQLRPSRNRSGSALTTSWAVPPATARRMARSRWLRPRGPIGPAPLRER